MESSPSTAEAPGAVYVLSDRAGAARDGHEYATLTALASRLARIQHLPYGGHCGSGPSQAHAYYVPESTLTTAEAARRGITSRHDLYGGIVPHAFVATKVVTHTALDPSETPRGWVDGLGDELADTVLPGFAFFSAAAARAAFERLSPQGPLRLKLARGVGGRGQFHVRDAAGLEQALDAIARDELQQHGATLELELHDATTYSIGMVECREHGIVYVGRQYTTLNSEGDEVYGGSDLWVSADGWDALLASASAPVRQAVEKALTYDRIQHDAYPGLLASRRNYDVVRGVDAGGVERLGVLEQSWRIGGATPAELRAIEAFAADPSVRLVRASCHEAHGEHAPPADCDVHYRGCDPRWGLITKYSRLRAHGHTP